MIDNYLTEEDGGIRNDHGPQSVRMEGKKNGYVSTLTRTVRGEAPLGRKVDIEEVDVRPTGGRGVKMSRRTLMHGRSTSARLVLAARLLSPSLLRGGNVGGGAVIVDSGEREVECGVRTMATMWDGEVGGMTGGLAKV